MTLQQEAYKRIDQLSDDGIKVLIDMIDKIKVMSISGFKESDGKQKENQRTGKAAKTEVVADTVSVWNEADKEDADLFPIRPVAVFPEENAAAKKIRAEKKKKFMASAGKIDIDEEAIREFRERSMV